MSAAGRFPDRVDVQEREPGTNTLGQALHQWRTLRRVWCRVEPLRGREFFAAGTMQDPSDYRVTMREDVARQIKPEHRLLWLGQPLGITSVPRAPKRAQEVELLCTKGQRDE